MDADILEKLTQIEDVVRQIRDDSIGSDVYDTLRAIEGLLERQNKLLYNLGVALCDINDSVPQYWPNLNKK